MSLFVAIVPSLEAIEDLDDRLQVVRVDRACQDLRWQPSSRWHVTMAFLGDLPEEADDELASHLDTLAAAHAGPTLRLAGAGTFGKHILWTGVEGIDDEQSASFAALGRTIHVVLRRAGFSLEHRPWRPHLTLARSRGSDARPATALLDAYSGPSWKVAELLAVRSEGGPSPVHTVIHRSHMAIG